MPFVLRISGDQANPVLPDAWGVQQTSGRLVYWIYQNNRTYFLIIFCRGGKYGCDGLNFFRFKGVAVPEFAVSGDESTRNWRFHPGTVTKQIVVKNFTADSGGNILTVNNHGYANGDQVRVRSQGGAVPGGLAANGKYFVINSSANSFQISDTNGGAAIDFTDNGSGVLKVWKADAGFDDPVQGRPQFFPELNLTFSNICYIEGMLPQTLSVADEEPGEFQFGIRCRKIADFDDQGNYLGNNFSANNARVQADILLNELKRPVTRNDWQSWFDFKTDCEQSVLDTITPDSNIPGDGLTGRYYNGENFEQLVGTRTDNSINFNFYTSSPEFPGLNTEHFSVRWDGKIKPQYSEVYTFKLIHDDGVRLWIDGQLIIDNWNQSPQTSIGQIALTANTLPSIRLEYFNYTSIGSCKLFWSSPSLEEQIVAAERLYRSDSQVKKAEAHVVFSGTTQAGAAIEEIMRRAPGWHIQDVGGKLKFLPPDRPIVHHFLYDPAEEGERWNIAAKSFECHPRTSDERVNFRIHYYNDLFGQLLEQKWVEGDRPALREQQGGLPSDVAPGRWGVMSRALTRRCAEMEMILYSDPDRSFTLGGQVDSYHVSKGDRVLVSHPATGDTFYNSVECLVTAENFGSGTADEKSYNLLPVKFPLEVE